MATFTFYNLWKLAQLEGIIAATPIDFDTDDIRLALVNSTYTPSQTHTVWGDAQGNEVASGNGYTLDGEVLANMAVDESGGTVTVNGDDVTWNQNGSGFVNARFAIFYKFDTNPAGSPLVGYIDFTSDKGNLSGDLTVQWNASGIFTLA